jgi:hypothetical protein
VRWQNPRWSSKRSSNGSSKGTTGETDVEHLHLFGEGELVAQHVSLRGVHRASTMPLLGGIEPSATEVT